MSNYVVQAMKEAMRAVKCDVCGQDVARADVAICSTCQRDGLCPECLPDHFCAEVLEDLGSDD